jgi:hypothetical protein
VLVRRRLGLAIGSAAGGWLILAALRRRAPAPLPRPPLALEPPRPEPELEPEPEPEPPDRRSGMEPRSGVDRRQELPANAVERIFQATGRRSGDERRSGLDRRDELTPSS